ncbi:MAG: gliding motility lipoprotein GldD [Bacteroidales bacterium]|nr:gliding motility lipoprotein GldD [Bacteroidales bacterium]
MNRTIVLLAFIAISLISCNETPNPKPDAYFRLTFPEHEYQRYSSDECPYTFDYPVYAKINNDEDYGHKPCWLNIDLSQYKAHIHITLKEINNNLDSLLDDSHTLVYKHTVKADAIEAKDYFDDSLKVYATIFFIEGNAASPMQFHITDSVNYMFRGSLYFKVAPNSDSLAPAVDFLKVDVMHLIESFEWK